MITSFDHLVLTVTDIPATIAFYTKVLGMSEVAFGEDRRALSFGDQKISLHQRGKEFEPKASSPTPGSADLCFISDTPLPLVISELTAYGVPIIEGPIARTGARGPILSVYFRDPDGNLIEICHYIRDDDEA